jgi:hypothetical protein
VADHGPDEIHVHEAQRIAHECGRCGQSLNRPATGRGADWRLP